MESGVSKTALQIHWLFRICCFMEFVGHGAFGILTKAGWLPYIQAFGFPESLGWQLMPLIGAVDIAFGILTLITPRRAFILYMAIWGFFTALLRPLAGEGWWEFFERSYNFGLPTLFFLTHSVAPYWKNSLFKEISTADLISSERLQFFAKPAQWIIISYLLGHGAFSVLMGKQNLLYQYVQMGMPMLAGHTYLGIYLMGCMEILLAVAVYFNPTRSVLIFTALWKIASEALYPLTGAYGGGWELMERGSSYGMPFLLLLFSQQQVQIQRSWAPRFVACAALLVGLLGFNWMQVKTPLKAKQPLVGERELVDRLRQGGYIVFFRHASRDLKTMPSPNPELDSAEACQPGTELTEVGVGEVKRLKKRMEELSIRLDLALASPSCRTQQMAALLSNYTHVHRSLAYDRMILSKDERSGLAQELQQLLSQKPAKGENHLYVSHGGVLDRLRIRVALGEMDAGVFEPTGNGEFRFLGKISRKMWLGSL